MRALDASGDWTFGAGIQNYLVGIDALSQSITTRLKQWKGNCFFATAEGVDWHNYLDIGTQQLLDIDIKRVILQTGGVVRLMDYSSVIDSAARSVAVTCTVVTIFGNLDYEETF